MTNDKASLSDPLRSSRRFSIFALVLALPLMLLGCPGSGNKPADGASATPGGPVKSDFDGERALEQVRKQVEFGPRPAGSAELEKTRNYLIDQLKSYGLKTTTEEFQPTTPLGERKM